MVIAKAEPDGAEVGDTLYCLMFWYLVDVLVGLLWAVDYVYCVDCCCWDVSVEEFGFEG